jgi:hypothetical protein
MRLLRSFNVHNENGGTLVLVALSMFLLLGIAALAVDMAAAFAWRAEAQKIADASALAGGSAFLDVPTEVVEQPASDRAYEYALRHSIKGEAIDSSEVTVQVSPADLRVRVWINRPDMPVWFARILGFDGVDIGAMAAAQALDAGAARCLKPIAVPDAWDDADDDTNDNNLWDVGEAWDFGSDPGDRYQRFNGSDDPDATNATGYGSELRGPDADWGRPLQLKAQDPNSEFNMEPGIFFPWRLPPDPNQGECAQGGGGGATEAGAATYRNNICTCNQSQINLFEPYDLQPGNMVGPTFQGIGELIDSDPTAYWEQAANGGRGGVARPNADSPTGWEDVGTASPRVVKMALFDPTQITGSGMQSIEFNNFALMFIEDMPSPRSPVNGRFMYFVGGDEGNGPVDGSLVRYLRIVE